jgi:hypothetical protein
VAPQSSAQPAPRIEFASEAELLRATVGLYRRRRQAVGDRSWPMPDAYATAIRQRQEQDAGR